MPQLAEIPSGLLAHNLHFGLVSASWDIMDQGQGEGIFISFSATMLGGPVQFQKVRKVSTAPAQVQTNLERLFLGGGEINDKNLNCSL